MNRLFVSFVVLVSLSFWGCASKKTTVEEKPFPSTGGSKISDKVETPAPEPSTPSSEIKEEIVLVLGGAGIASFATVGLFKRFQLEGIRISYVISTGWPALFVLGHGFLRSVHDLEWFAMRLKPEDFFSTGLFDKGDFETHDKLSTLVKSFFKQKIDLRESKVPIVLTASETLNSEVQVFEKGEWAEPLLKAMSVPGIYQPYPKNATPSWVASVEGIDVNLALERGAKIVVAIDMYEDYLRHQDRPALRSSGDLFRRLYLSKLKKNIRAELAKAQVSGRIVLNKAPNDFSAKREAILAGYQEASRIIRELKK